MDTISPSDLARWCSGKWEGGVPDGISGLTNDTRTLARGQLFAAFKTEVRDGHDFLDAAQKCGASGAIVERFQPEVPLPQLVVEEVGSALLAAARAYRLTWKGEVIGITGSCGKTTCKDLLSCLFSSRRCLSTKGNLNNLIGVPMSILRPEGHACEFAVLEAGISETGEMKQLANAIEPDWAIISAIGPAHLEDLGDVETVAREKGLLARGSRIKGTFLGETCLPYLDMLDLEKGQLVKRDRHHSVEWAYTFESKGGTTTLRQRIGGSVQVFEYNGVGTGLASNVAICLAVAFTAGLEIEELRAGLANWKPSELRNEWRPIGPHVALIDCYNANPVSMRDSLKTFAENTPEEEGRFYLVGCMEELGHESSELHRELGRSIPMRKGDFLLVIGGEAESVLHGMKDASCDMDRCFAIEELEEARGYMESFKGNYFLKGSRRYRLESVLDYLPDLTAKGGAA